MNNKEELIKRKEKLTIELNKIKEELDMFDQGTVRVINFRGATVGSGEEIGNYEMFDVLWLLSDEEYKDLMNVKNDDAIYEVLNNIIDNHDDGKLDRLNIIDDLFNIYDVLYFDKEKTYNYYSCELDVRFGFKYNNHDIASWTEVSLKVLNVPVGVYDNFNNVCVSSYPLDHD